MMKLALALALLPLPVLADAVVAARTLRPGTVIAPGDVVIAADRNGALSQVDQVIGQELRVLVSEGRPIEPAFLGAPTVVERNQPVTIAYEKANLRIQAEGRALSAGSIGQVIRVMNNASRVTVSGRIAPDGTVIIGQN